MFRLGLLINPFAGIGGALALKGSDGAEIREKALAAGAKKMAPDKAKLALGFLTTQNYDLEIVTAAGLMGETVCKALGCKHQIVYQSANEQSEAIDTEKAVESILQTGIDLLLFVGGDGTARNVYSALLKHYQQDLPALPVLGVPAGCKIHSGVYAITPNGAGKVLEKVIAGELVSLMEAEVRDIDEDKFRQGVVIAKHYGDMHVPAELEYIQAVKMGGKESDELVLADIAAEVINLLDEHPDVYFVMGSGSTIDFIMQEAGLENTVLGIDVVHQHQLVLCDANAQALVDLAEKHPMKLVITAIGGQGHVFGRGNQQLSPKLIEKVGRENIHIVATKNKIQSLAQKGFIADTGDADLDKKLAGPIPVISGYKDKVLYFIRGE